MEARNKVRGEELVALADTIKILNDDDAMSLFKKVQDSNMYVRAYVCMDVCDGCNVM